MFPETSLSIFSWACQCHVIELMPPNLGPLCPLMCELIKEKIVPDRISEQLLLRTIITFWWENYPDLRDGDISFLVTALILPGQLLYYLPRLNIIAAFVMIFYVNTYQIIEFVFVLVFVSTFKSDSHSKCVAISAQSTIITSKTCPLSYLLASWRFEKKYYHFSKNSVKWHIIFSALIKVANISPPSKRYESADISPCSGLFHHLSELWSDR